MAGMAAEQIIFGDRSTVSGGSPRSDVVEVTRIAHGMVTRFGFGRRLSVQLGEVSRYGAVSDLSDGPTRADIDAILGAEFARAKNILMARKTALVAFAEILRNEKTVSGDRIASLLATSCEETPSGANLSV